MHVKYKQHKTDKCLEPNSWNGKHVNKDKEKLLIRNAEVFGNIFLPQRWALMMLLWRLLHSKADQIGWFFFIYFLFFVKVWRSRINLDSNYILGNNNKKADPFFMANIFMYMYIFINFDMRKRQTSDRLPAQGKYFRKKSHVIVSYFSL